MARATSSLPVPGLPLEEQADVLRRDALERREELAHRRRLADELPERLLRRSCAARLRAVVEVEPQARVADDELGARRELDLRHAVRAEPRAVRAARVAHVHALAAAPQLEVHRR